MDKQPLSKLSPEQAADVIKHLHTSSNEESRNRGWKDKTSLARTAVRAVGSTFSLSPDKAPMLTPKEGGQGLDFIQNPPKSNEYYAAVDDLVEKKSIPYSEAIRQIDSSGLR